MKTLRLFTAIMFIASIGALSAFAQQRTGTTATPASPATAQATGPVPSSKVAYVDTQRFADEKLGITRYVNAQKGLEREFAQRVTELETIVKRVQTLADEISKTENVAAPAEIQRKREEAERLEREGKFKKESLEADFRRRAGEVLGPITADIRVALDAFAKQRGITMTLDISRLAEAVVTADTTMDITAAFVADYNSKNPATASVVGPGR